MSGSFPLLFLAQAQAELNAAQTEPTSWVESFKMIGILLAIFVLPFVLSRFLATGLKMKDYATSFGIILAAVIGSIIIISTVPPKYGPDINGGTTLIYELDKSAMQGDKTVKAQELRTSLNQRLNPAGTRDVKIQAVGDDQIEIIVADVDQMEINDIKRAIEQAGILKFRIVANTFDHADIIELARQQSIDGDVQIRRSNQIENEAGETVALWRKVGREETPSLNSNVYPLAVDFTSDTLRNGRTGEFITIPPSARSQSDTWFEEWLVRQGVEDVEVLLALQRRDTIYPEVNGDDLSNVSAPFGANGFEVAFSLTPSGGQRMFRMTSLAQPRGNLKSRMAIVLDNVVLSAPNLNSPISTGGRIEGNFSKSEVDFLVNILKSGSLPAALKKQPIAQQQIGAVLGANTIKKGFYAATASLIATLIFVVLYYRFSGFIACIALLLNIALIFTAMLLIQQPITLPGLAGLVLTVGMSVDANVLIFERIREEVSRKATGRMAIRNGFGRAMSTIIDANITTLISAIVLYWAGTDQIRGFAVVLVIGILISMFTAIFCSRIFFDVAERWRLANLSMTDGIGMLRNTVLGQKDVNFLGMQKYAVIVSSILVVVGILSVAGRGKDVLDIDFNGGSSITFVLEKPVDADTVRDMARDFLTADGEPIQTNVTKVLMDDFEDDTVYRVETSLRDVDLVTKRLTGGFAAAENTDLVTYKVEVVRDASAAETGAILSGNAGKFVSMNLPQESNAEASPQETPAPQTGSSIPATVEVVVGEGVVGEDVVGEDVVGEGLLIDPGIDPGIELGSESGDETADVETIVGSTVPEKTELTLKFAPSKVSSDESIRDGAKINAKTLRENISRAAEQAGLTITESQLKIEPIGEARVVALWQEDSGLGFDSWKVTLPVSESDAGSVVDQLQNEMLALPVFLSVDNIGGRVAGQMQFKALIAILFSLVCIVAYIWFRFQRVAYGLAAVVALTHDVVITLGFVAISHWLYKPLGFLLLEDFKISLTMVAAFLTIIGYSLNDTIVVFDRIREVKGKSPVLTGDMLNASINQTLSRTILTSSTTLLVVLVLYIFGGEGIHGFSFCLLIGMLIGTYSSVFVASPVLLWLVRYEEKANEPAGRRRRVTA
jgi:SecD/SecF fusion protein